MQQKKSFKMNPAEKFISSTPADRPQDQQNIEGFTPPKGYVLKPESKNARLQLLIRPSTKAALQRAAQVRGISTNELINQILNEYADQMDD